VGLTAGTAVAFYTVFIYATTWLQQTAGVPARTALAINTAAMALTIPAIPLAGWASDRFGRRPVLALTAGALALLAYPCMVLMSHGRPAAILLGQGMLGLLISAMLGVMPATMAELAPWRVRCSVLSVAYNLSMAVLGGTAPMVGAWLVARTQTALAPAVYVAICCGITFVAALLLPATVRHSLTREFEAARFR
jgi:MHS family proline/betaine transporter-like MFS transporter